jgi:membrane protease YdiL (CAAX protease family)
LAKALQAHGSELAALRHLKPAAARALRREHRVRLFLGGVAVLWATLLIVNNYMEKADIRWQLIVNLIVLFFGASCLMLRHYRLNPREALALRAPKLMVWPAVLVAVPTGLLTAAGLFRLANLFIPISPKIMREFEQNVIPPDISSVQLIFFLCVMPAIFEEITFRGMLLHGLSRRLQPAPLAITVGVIFGIFHVALFRFAPTACLGVMLAAVVLLTGSIFPAMLWHGLSNLLGILAYQYQIPLEELDPLSYLLGAAILAVCFWIIWRNRTPYPGLRPNSRA